MKQLQTSAASMLVEQVRNDILTGVFKADERVRQELVAEKYNVSRIPVREALMQLEAQGLLSFVPQKGFVVRGMSRAEIEDIFELRLKIEPDLVAGVVANSDDEIFADAVHLFEQMGVEYAAHKTSNDFANFHIDFHLALIQASTRERSKEMTRHLYILSERYIRHHHCDHGEQAEQEHRDILDACLARKPEEAAACVERHIRKTLEDLLSEFQENA
ncbi:MAG: GntR family transcriptional regulator [Kordiimonas sp.]